AGAAGRPALKLSAVHSPPKTPSLPQGGEGPSSLQERRAAERVVASPSPREGGKGIEGLRGRSNRRRKGQRSEEGVVSTLPSEARWSIFSLKPPAGRQAPHLVARRVAAGHRGVQLLAGNVAGL